jgi:hypothetical protein
MVSALRVQPAAFSEPLQSQGTAHPASGVRMRRREHRCRKLLEGTIYIVRLLTRSLPNLNAELRHGYEAYAPAVFCKAGMFAAVIGIAGTLVAIVGSLWRARQNKLVTTYSSAPWANIEEFKSAKLFAGQGVFLGKLSQTHLLIFNELVALHVLNAHVP